MLPGTPRFKSGTDRALREPAVAKRSQAVAYRSQIDVFEHSPGVGRKQVFWHVEPCKEQQEPSRSSVHGTGQAHEELIDQFRLRDIRDPTKGSRKEWFACESAYLLDYAAQFCYRAL